MQEFYDRCLIRDKQREKNGKSDDSWPSLAKEFGFRDGEQARDKWRKYKKKHRIDTNNNKTNITPVAKSNYFNPSDVEKEKIRKEKLETKKYFDQFVKFDTLVDILKEETNKLENLPKIDYNFVTSKNNRSMIMCLSDLHIGMKSNLHSNKVNIDILKDRLIKYFREVVNIAEDNKISHITLCLIGDLIEGQGIFKGQEIHSDRNIIEQILETSEILSRLINELSRLYQVEIRYCYGNHSRISDIYSDNEIISFEKLIIEFMKLRINSNNVKIVDSNGLYDVFKVKGLHYMITHGDIVRNVNTSGYKLKEIIEEQENIKIQNIIVGHFHHNKDLEQFSNGGGLIVCGSLVGANYYSIKKVNSASLASQKVLIINDKGVYCTYNVKLN